MLYQFDTEDRATATAALCVYAVYRSRNKARYKVKVDMWSQIERFVKAAAKRANSLGEFLEALKPRLACESISPKAMAVGTMPVADGFDLRLSPPGREFLTAVVSQVDQAAVLRLLYRETTWIVLLVRDRLERERPVEAMLEAAIDEVEMPLSDIGADRQ